ERKGRIEAALQTLVAEEKMSKEQVAAWLPKVLADESILPQLQAWPAKPKAAEPLAPSSDLSAEASGVDTVKALERFNAPMKAWQRGNRIPMESIGAASTARATFFKKHAAKIHEVMAAGTNTIDTTLQR